MRQQIAIEVEWDMGHRLPHHRGACCNLHGHRYRAEVTLQGNVRRDPTHSEDGMIVDFGHVKSKVRALLVNLDHRFLVSGRDPLAAKLRDLPGVVIVGYTPTAENIAGALLTAIRTALQTEGVLRDGVEAVRLRLWETPTSWADAT